MAHRSAVRAAGTCSALLVAVLALLSPAQAAAEPATRGRAAHPMEASASRAAPACGWREPPRTYPDGERWTCTAIRWADGDTLKAWCGGGIGTVAVRVRRVDTDERGHQRWRPAREELRRWTAGHAFAVLPHHDSGRRVVAGGVNVGAAVDAAGWSKAEADCPKR